MDGLIFRRKRKAEAQSPEGGKRVKAAASSPAQAPDGASTLLEGAEQSHTDPQLAEPDLRAEGVPEGSGSGLEGGNAPMEPPPDIPVSAESTEALLLRLPTASEGDRLIALCNELAKVGIPGNL